MSQRIISLWGSFSLEYPENWKCEIDEVGNYLFYDNLAGSGVVRIILFGAQDDAASFFDDLLGKQREFDAKDLNIGGKRFVSYVQVHELNNQDFNVYYWITRHAGKVILFTYTAQSMMTDLPLAMKEREMLLEVMESLSFLNEQTQT